jgi:hypothetical protein
MFSLCLNITSFITITILKVPKWEIFDLLDFCYFYITYTLWVGDLETLLHIFLNLGVHTFSGEKCLSICSAYF